MVKSRTALLVLLSLGSVGVPGCNCGAEYFTLRPDAGPADGEGEAAEGEGDVIVGEGEGEGDFAGEGEGDVLVGEGEGDVIVGEGEGEGDFAGEGEGDVIVGEGEGDVIVGEGEGDVIGGEGEGEGEADVIVGEGEGEPPFRTCAAGTFIEPACGALEDGARLTRTPESSSNAALAWNGCGYGVVWVEGASTAAEVFFGKLSIAGALSSPLRLTVSPNESVAPRLAWSGNSYGVTWLDRRNGRDEVFFMILDESGAILSDEQPLGDGREADIVWDGERFVAVWRAEAGSAGSPTTELTLSRINDAGVVLDARVVLQTLPGIADHMRIAFNGIDYIIAFRSFGSGAGFTLWNDSLAPTGAGLSVSGNVGSVSIASDQTTIAFVYQGPVRQMHVIVTDAAAVPLLPADDVVADGFLSAPEVVAATSGYAVAWPGTVIENGAQQKFIFAAQVANDGTVAPVQRAFAGSDITMAPGFNGTSFNFVWTDPRFDPNGFNLELMHGVWCP